MGGTLIAIGDSITKGTHKYGLAKPCFAEIIKERLGFDTLINYGYNGTSISTVAETHRQWAMSVYVDEMAKGDCVLVAGGTNDYGGNVPLGTPADKTDVSFYGALLVLYEKLVQKYAGARIYVITPILRRGEKEKPNNAGFWLSDYRKAICTRAQEFEFAIIHGEKFFLNPDDEACSQKYIVDGLHPNQAGHELYAEFIMEEMKKYDNGNVCV